LPASWARRLSPTGGRHHRSWWPRTGGRATPSCGRARRRGARCRRGARGGRGSRGGGGTTSSGGRELAVGPRPAAVEQVAEGLGAVGGRRGGRGSGGGGGVVIVGGEAEVAEVVHDAVTRRERRG